MTLSDKSYSNFLEARDRRQDSLSRALGKSYPAVLSLSLNIPGHDKAPPGSQALFCLMLDELSNVFPGLVLLEQSCDVLGPCAIIGLDIDPVVAKKRCMNLETSHPAARLVDLDVYSGQGKQIDRGSLDSPARTCLVCNQAAVECIRDKRHAFDEVIGRVHVLLTPFRT